MGQCWENPSSGSPCRAHPAPNHSYQRQIRLYINRIRVRQPVNRRHYLLLFINEFVLMDENRHRIDTGGNMLKGNPIILECLENFSAKPYFGIHHILFYINGAKSFFSCNTGNYIFGFLAGALHNPCSFCLRAIGIPDINGNPFPPYRENRVLMEHCRPHVRKFPKFSVSNGLNSHRILNNPGICHQESRHIGPVLIYIGFYRPGHDRTCNIGSSPGESFHPSVPIGSIKSGDDRPFHMA